jgi:predicted RecB family nuclease
MVQHVWGGTSPVTIPFTSEVVVAHSQCPRKAYLLLYGDSPGPSHEYLRILEGRADANRENYLHTVSQADAASTRQTLRHGAFEAYCDVLTEIGRGNYEPTLIVGTCHVTKDQRMNLAYVGHVLGQLHSRRPPGGMIVTRGGKAQKVKLEASYASLGKTLPALRAWSVQPPPDAPEVILNNHCPVCPFRDQCLAVAEKADSLTLLDRMTPKLLRRFRKKGIFTVTQLSYLYRPRRRKRNRPASTGFKVELQALAIRTGKIYIATIPKVSRSRLELFLDIEGIPDEDFQYLVGLTVWDGNVPTHHAFWADGPEDEGRIWAQVFEKLGEYPGAPIYHYGAYERRALEKACNKYQLQGEGVTGRLINVSSWVYGKIYFPVRSNGLKELGKFVGASWTALNPSGLQSLLWRHLWEEGHDASLRQQLLRYNEEDCGALRLLVARISAIVEAAGALEGVDFADRPRRHSTEVGAGLHTQFEQMIKFAHFDYKQRRISFRQETGKGDGAGPAAKEKKKRRSYCRTSASRVSKIIRVRRRMKCPRHGKRLTKTEIMVERVVIDLCFSKSGCRKRLIKYVGAKSYCESCHCHYCPPVIGKLPHMPSLGSGFRAWVTYQRVALRQPYDAISQMMEDMFEEHLAEGTAVSFVQSMAQRYQAAEAILLRRIRESRFVHGDETKVNIQGAEHYVWVFTDGMHVIFRLTDTRETTVVQEVLNGYSGVLVTDFYAGYDAVNCRQQKCLVHLIRDINNDLWNNPFDTDLEMLASKVRELLLPILCDVERYGLRQRHLQKHRKAVERFYKDVIDGTEWQSEVVHRFVTRFRRYRVNLFVFLGEDSIPWNNNTGERAIRHLAVQRKISGFFYKNFAPHHLVLLGIAQTCRFQHKSFLKFLLSGEKDVDTFRPKRRRATRLLGESSESGNSIADEK